MTELFLQSLFVSREEILYVGTRTVSSDVLDIYIRFNIFKSMSSIINDQMSVIFEDVNTFLHRKWGNISGEIISLSSYKYIDWVMIITVSIFILLLLLVFVLYYVRKNSVKRISLRKRDEETLLEV